MTGKLTQFGFIAWLSHSIEHGMSGMTWLMTLVILALFSAIMGSTTHYSSPASSVLAASGFVTQKEWWKMGFVFGLFYILVYGIVGLAWMKLIGMW